MAKQQEQKRLTRSGRFVRGGSVPTPSTPDGATMRELLREFARQLDAIAADEGSSAREKSQDTARLVAEHRREILQWKAKSAAGMNRIDSLVRTVQQKVSAFESSLSPVSVRRLEKLADSLGDVNLQEAMSRAVERRDAEMIVALSLREPRSALPAKALAVIFAPNEWRAIVDEAPQAVEMAAAVKVWEEGLAEVTVVEDPWSSDESRRPTSQELFGAFNRGLGSVADIESLLPFHWPPTVQAVINPEHASAPVGKPASADIVTVGAAAGGAA